MVHIAQACRDTVDAASSMLVEKNSFSRSCTENDSDQETYTTINQRGVRSTSLLVNEAS